MSQADSPEARAEAAARDLADTGRAVSARAVRTAAGVSMAVAAAAAKAWKEAQEEDAAIEVPAVPEDVQGRLAAIWADAYRAAAETLTPERDQLKAQVQELTEAVSDLESDVAGVEEERDTALSHVETVEKAAAKTEAAVRQEVTELREKLAKSEGQVEQLVAANKMLNDRVDGLLDQLTGESTT